VRKAIGLILAITIGMQSAHAENTVQQWLTLTGDVRLDANDNAFAVAVRRSAPDDLKMAQRVLQLGWRHRVAGKVSLIASLGHVTSYRDNLPNRIEMRLSEGILMPVGHVGGGRIEGRFLFEEILVRGSQDIGVRGRPRLRWTRPISGKIDLQLSDEAIFALNRTDAGQVAGLVANRAGAGVRFALSKHFGVQPSYTWQHVNRIAAPNRDDHILGLTLDAQF
jgi:Protein of unknown function (DUF2490)